jgi:hypothetical protein
LSRKSWNNENFGECPALCVACAEAEFVSGNKRAAGCSNPVAPFYDTYTNQILDIMFEAVPENV